MFASAFRLRLLIYIINRRKYRKFETKVQKTWRCVTFATGFHACDGIFSDEM